MPLSLRLDLEMEPAAHTHDFNSMVILLFEPMANCLCAKRTYPFPPLSLQLRCGEFPTRSTGIYWGSQAVILFRLSAFFPIEKRKRQRRLKPVRLSRVSTRPYRRTRGLISQ